MAWRFWKHELSLYQYCIFNGETAFKLHDTYGFPFDLTADICRERNVTVDSAAFDAAMASQKEQARAAGKFKMAANLEYDGRCHQIPRLRKVGKRCKVLWLRFTKKVSV